MASKKKSLGKGLGALLQGANIAAEIRDMQAGGVETLEKDTKIAEDASPSPDVQIVRDKNARDKVLKNIPIEFIQRGKYQPRKDINQEALEELASSIKAQGVMQPIVVREIGNNNYEIIAGERRWRACQIVGMEKIPAMVRNVSDRAVIAMALIENVQREDLNPVEEATSLNRLKDEFDLTHQDVADAVGKSRAAVTNLLRLMSLEPRVIRLLENGDIDMGHGRALLGLTGDVQIEASSMVVEKDLSVRQTESLVARMNALNEKSKTRADKKTDPDIKVLEEKLSEKVGAIVAIQHSSKGKGKLVISYNTLDELDGVLEHIN